MSFLLASPHSLKRLSIGKVPDFGKSSPHFFPASRVSAAVNHIISRTSGAAATASARSDREQVAIHAVIPAWANEETQNASTRSMGGSRHSCLGALAISFSSLCTNDHPCAEKLRDQRR
jgi:hypothetical protein